MRLINNIIITGSFTVIAIFHKNKNFLNKILYKVLFFVNHTQRKVSAGEMILLLLKISYFNIKQFFNGLKNGFMCSTFLTPPCLQYRICFSQKKMISFSSV